MGGMTASPELLIYPHFLPSFTAIRPSEEGREVLYIKGITIFPI